ncbi:hypothetical protein UlMin_006515 [Ulmus minor]
MPTSTATAPARQGIGSGVRVSEFDYSVENHFKAMDAISELCGEEVEEDTIDESEARGWSSTVTFLREWKLFNYEQRNVRFSCQVGSAEGKKINEINLQQFSSATVPKEGIHGDSASPVSRASCCGDFVMYVGGPVWGLDWCPRVHARPDSSIKREFIAIAAHPPGSSYHKIGAPLSGRGLVQIWSLLNVSMTEEDIPPVEKPKPGRKKSVVMKEKPNEPKRPRGRPKKKPIEEDIAKLDSNCQNVEALDVQFPENSSNLCAIEGVPGCYQDYHGKEQCCDSQTETACVQNNRASEGNHENDTSQLLITHDESLSSRLIQGISGHDPGTSGSNPNFGSWEMSSTRSIIPSDVALPRVVSCLAHNGKVVWDLKWQPSNIDDSKCKHRMGYLAVLLGNGSLEVWDVPLPHTIKAIYSSSHGEATDPRFMKLDPVFRCSMLKSGGVQSIPLTVEWSASAPHEFLLAGCHDGTVAVWKFSAKSSSKDTRPLLCFSADTAPIRAVAWAPIESESESAKVILTAGHDGLKFWDLRDPFRPLWDLHPVPRIIYSLDWLPDPSCVMLTFDDGTMRVLSLKKAAYDVPVTGKPFVGSKQQGLHNYCCSSFAIWSIQVSRITGMVAYCGADGNVIRFQLTPKAVDKDPSKNRAPHFLCGSLTQEESSVTINTPRPNSLFPMKKAPNKGGDNPIAMRDILSKENQAKPANEKMEKLPAPIDQPLALCYGDNAGVESDPEVTLASLKRKKPPKSGSSTKKKREDDLALVPVNDEPRSLPEKEIKKEETGKFEVLPPKAVAMHRVRWNMNKGSERWLAYGGAAGIVRCQEIVLSDIDKKLAKKK